MCVRSIKGPMQKMSGNLFNDLRKHSQIALQTVNEVSKKKSMLRLKLKAASQKERIQM